jgi:hypothetical protein
MAISDTQKVDLLYKKIAWAATKTDTNPPKEAYNEANPSPLLIRGDTLWQLSGSIPASIPSATSSTVQVYKDGTGAWSATVECTELAVTDNRTWATGLTNWIDPQFGSTYFVKVYVDSAGSTTPQTTGTALQAAGVNDDQWYFDYQSGILNFIGTNLPTSIATGVTGKSVFISGARYVGPTGVVSWSNGLTIGNISISGNTISSTNGNATIVSTGNISAGNISAGSFAGNIRTDYLSSNTSNVIVITGTGALALPVGNISNRPLNPTLGELRYNTDPTINTIEYYNGTIWISSQTTITDQQITPDGESNAYVLNQIVPSAESVLVSINGTVQRPGASGAYTITTGNTIVFSEVPAVTDIVDVRYIASATVPQLVGLTTDIGTTGNASLGNVNVVGNVLIRGNLVLLGNANNTVITTVQETQTITYITAANIQVGELFSNVNTVTSAPLTVVGGGPTIIDYFDSTVYQSSKYAIQSTSSANIQVSDVWVLHNGSNAYCSVTGTVTTANLGFYSASMVGSNVRLIFTPTMASTAIRIHKTRFVI